MTATPLTVLYRDDHLVAIDKPSGWLVHRSNLDRHETRILVQALRDQIGQHVHPAHRLDKGTSGVMLFALDPAAAGKLGEQFGRHAVRKTYWAVVRGWPPESGRIDHPLKSERDKYGDVPPDAEAQTACTEFRRLATVELPHAVDRYPTARYALVELHPLTGRRHQLRRHMKHIAHPIIGDATHGKGRHNRWFQATFGCDRLLLACTELSFDHPADRRAMTIRAPVGDQFARVVAALGWSVTS
ncbi:MAG: pseudouridylate synthase [Gammaproteobacteria bacterium]|nr:pseudouridylate synthase [Gammaproteobacteria bacterium]MBU1416439.1 pseudouridylate synthase [Gammaproteobacteria bacterium]